MAKYRTSKTLSHDSSGTLSFVMQKISTKFWWITPMWVPNAVDKNCIFQLAEKSTAQTPYHWKFMSVHHSGLRPWWWAGRRICGVINNVGGSRCLLITLMAHLISSTLIVMKVCLSHITVTCIWRGASHAHCMIVEPIATMHIQNCRYLYKKWQLLKVLLRLICDLFLLNMQD